MRLEFIGASILFFAAVFAVIARNTIAPGLVGLSVAYALQAWLTEIIFQIVFHVFELFLFVLKYVQVVVVVVVVV